ncbi:MAG: hypothetical protein QF807_05175 [Candidatus Thalassarchaeaceae archaeon]|jgi:TATA-box binding protein (TBP) (component of TFIID and TFIIIB)|nr:hypothetical protein [Candidatus Thalassarchaeaceae archaeon]MDP7043390.1 hypothetical protein [Candidatus Thalassarchaeaceae archaeon]
MARKSAVKVRIENQLIRFTAPEPFGSEEVIDTLGGKKNGKFVILALKNPRATLLVDQEGRLVVHGTNHSEIAWAAAREMLLRLGRSDEGLTTEKGPLVVSFDYGQPLRIDQVPEYFPDFEEDSRLDCIRTSDSLHDMDILLFSNGRGVALGARHKNLVEMAATHWGTRFESENLFVKVLVKTKEQVEPKPEPSVPEEVLDVIEDES